ncbi:MAG: hypothetical protein QGH93_13105 [Gammaproteobacteria bacterium]|jgi:hypothetical protein|nr:hypothetical protein [Gammaproteobacteria bacterium]
MTDLADKFLTLELDVSEFGHKAHVQVAFELLCRCRFMEATTLYADRLADITRQIGLPEKFNMTVTVAFMGLIAERIQDVPAENFSDFIAQNPDLLDSRVLSRWYSKERLSSSLSRSVFLLPDLVPVI